MDKKIENAINSTLFTAPVLGDHLERFLRQEGPKLRELARKALKDGVENIYWVGCGNSWVNLYSGKYLMDKFTDIPGDCLTSYDFVWRNPIRCGPKSMVFLASFSGATEDTVSALRHAKFRNAHTIAIVNKADSLMGHEADEVIAYNSKATFILPLAVAYIFTLELARLKGNSIVDPILQGLTKIPELMIRQYQEGSESALRLAEEFRDENLFYTLGSGPLWGLAYKYGLTVFMENMRVNGSFIDLTEFRHGPVEMFDKQKPAIVVLLGTDESRLIGERVYKLCQTQGAHTLLYDMASYPDIHPYLAPFVLMIPLQWFAVWSSFLRGITDLDERVLMGRGILGQGKGVTWP